MKTLYSAFLAGILVLGLVAQAPARSNDQASFSQAELDQMLAPIALYPDTVLSHVLIAATYPLEVVQAARWSRANPGPGGQDAVEAVGAMDWDPSVMALVAFPELLDRLDQDIDWTRRLGDAFLFQEEQVVGTIQSLREQAYAHGHLRSNDQVRVVRETRYIYIEPARTRVVHLPYYDPVVVFGGWRWSHHPPIRWHHPVRFVRGVSFFWGPAYRIAPTFYFSSFHWSRRQVVVVKHHHHHHYRGRRAADWRFHSGRDVAHHKEAHRWQHEPRHRRGVSYRHSIDARRNDRYDNRHDNRDDNRHLANQARTTGSDFAAARQQVETRRSQRSWASDRRESLRLSDRSVSRSTPSAAARAGRERLRSAQSPRAPERSFSESAPGRSTSAAPSTRQRSVSASRVRERLERSSSAPVRPATAPRASTRPAAVRSRPGIEVPRSSTRPAPTRSAPAARTSRQVDRVTSRVSRPARSTRSAARPSSQSSRPGPRSQPPRSMAPPRSAPTRSAPARSDPTRSYPGHEVPRAQAPRRTIRDSSRAPSRASEPPPRQRGQARQRERSRIRG